MADNDYILGEASSDQYLNLQPLRVGDNATMLAWGVDSPGIRYQEDDEYAVQVVIPISPNGYAANVPPIGTTEILSFSSGNCSSKITEPTGSGPSSTRSQIAREYARVDCETHQYLQILKARTAKYREEKATTRIAFNKELWKLEDKAADARVETWRNDVAVFQEMVRMRKEKVASDALLRAEVHRLRGENEARKYHS